MENSYNTGENSLPMSFFIREFNFAHGLHKADDAWQGQSLSVGVVQGIVGKVCRKSLASKTVHEPINSVLSCKVRRSAFEIRCWS
ncbi:hypothetical protein NPIL_653001 [Nephila pilipes]|uniref:Uncharacterized protein n=1 Tax=Nephila pilipes TaxID=299642 RepID=A0A8X6TJI4_NEPPI|nr:hypothetical protein NPIL_653001 [Nephila pilipes]